MLKVRRTTPSRSTMRGTGGSLLTTVFATGAGLSTPTSGLVTGGTGVTGVSLDDLVSVCTRLARKMEALGMETMFDTAETANKLMKDVGPLMVQAQRIAEELRPLLSEVRQGGMVTSLDSLMESATAIAEDARRLNNGIITKDNIDGPEVRKYGLWSEEVARR